MDQAIAASNWLNNISRLIDLSPGGYLWLNFNSLCVHEIHISFSKLQHQIDGCTFFCIKTHAYDGKIGLSNNYVRILSKLTKLCRWLHKTDGGKRENHVKNDSKPK
ncbi:hypothetical protein NPIL_579041 [Nephila pilipes]|uniref:Uncharacterized protein n=1 Tax=Nephila pilipes TaxID=299642 RepID=A0A8X6NCT2_NEPPI|nr:hypothetical protein NPIL_579041 [Nephila pilipes]